MLRGYINEENIDIIKEAESSTSDIIMIGSQSGTTPISNKNLDYMCIRQHELLLGANPDAIILCFNYFDSVDYIKKTIRAIEGTDSGKVIALYMSALEYPKLGFSVRNKRNVISSKPLCYAITGKISK